MDCEGYASEFRYNRSKYEPSMFAYMKYYVNSAIANSTKPLTKEDYLKSEKTHYEKFRLMAEDDESSTLDLHGNGYY